MSSSNVNDPEGISPDQVDRSPDKDGGEASLESGLWNLDDDSPDWLPAKKISSASGRVPAINPYRAQKERIFAVNEKKLPFIAVNEMKPEQRIPADTHIRLNIRPQTETSLPASGSSKKTNFGREFDELENWVDDGGEATGKEIEDAAKLAELDAMTAIVTQAPLAESEEIVEVAPLEQPVLPEPTTAPELTRRRCGYSMLEKLGMIALVVALLAVFAGVLIYSSTSLSVESLDSRKVKFPVAGKHLMLRTAKTYWRDVVRSGAESDVVRRGTRMLPVVELSYSGGPGVIRVMFRDENGDSVGDAITRRVETDGNVTIAATAGFNDVGMHAAYRTGENEPWKIEVYEVSGTNVSQEGSAKLFEMDISADRR